MLGNISICSFLLKLKKISADMQFVENITSSKIIFKELYNGNFGAISIALGV